MLKKILVLTAVFMTFATASATAKVYIDLSAPAERRLPLAIGEFKEAPPTGALPDEASDRIGRTLSNTLRTDLGFSGLFSIIDAKEVIEGEFKQCLPPSADALVSGAFSVDKEKLSIEVKLLDCTAGKTLLFRRYIGSTKNPRKLIHYFADQLYEALTGRKGVFSTRILFVSDKTGNKEIYSSDYDGGNVIQLTRNRHINISPQWLPSGEKIIYSSYKNGEPGLYMLDLRTGKDTAVSSRPGINIGAKYSRDGTRIALTLSGEKSPELYLLTPATGVYTRLTDNYGIDVSPTWSPDGTRLAYTSDSSGNPHIFMIDLTVGKSTRLTFDGRYNSSPAWSPDGKLIAFSRAESGGFNIWVMDASGGNERQLTFEGNNQSPSWSPDNRYIVFSGQASGGRSLYIMQADGTGIRRIDTGVGNESAPAWSPYMQ